MQHLIVNADDLGSSRIVNDAILELMATGTVTSATIMGNGPDMQYLAPRLSKLPAASFGVHLNITEFAPLTKNSDLRRLCGDGERLVKRAGALRFKPRLLQAIYEEFCAQVRAVKGLGVLPTHLDSHHHVHTQPAMFPVIKAVQAQFGIRRLRLSKNLYLPEQMPVRALRVKKELYNILLRRVYRSVSTELFTEFSTFHQLLKQGRLPPYRSLEAMVHPGLPRYESETQTLRTKWMADLRDTKLISFAELTGGARA